MACIAACAFAMADTAWAQTTPCDAISDPVMQDGIAGARTRMRLEWRDIDGIWTTGYVLKGETPNPFALVTEPRPAKPLAAVPPTAPIKGYVAARVVRCNVIVTSWPARTLRVRFSAAAVRFQEARSPWSPPIPDGILGEFAMAHEGGRWTMTDLSAEKSVLPPDRRLDMPPETIARTVTRAAWPAAGLRPSREKPSAERRRIASQR